MKNKARGLVPIVLVFAGLLTLAGCGVSLDNEVQDSAPQSVSSQVRSAPAEKSPAQETSFGFSYKGKQLVPGTAQAEVLAVTGEAKDVFESPSCAFSGTDRVYYFTGFELNTYPDDSGTERLLSVELKDDSVETEQGLYLGMTKEESRAIYGSGQENDLGTEIVWTNREIALRVIFTDDKATGISLVYMPAQALVNEHEQSSAQ